MMSIQSQFSDADSALFKTELEALLRSSNGILTCVLASADGFVIAEANLQSSNGEKLAAMSSSMIGLAAAIAQELSLGALDALVMDAFAGKVVMLSVPTSKADLVLLVSCGAAGTIGHVLYSAKAAAKNVINGIS